ncbi:hypothetical protein AO380_0344 [Moraxella catarrhalis]|nr:hypothetical protein AO380_0344 [Moraxella catarrhalis]
MPNAVFKPSALCFKPSTSSPAFLASSPNFLAPSPAFLLDFDALSALPEKPSIPTPALPLDCSILSKCSFRFPKAVLALSAFTCMSKRYVFDINLSIKTYKPAQPRVFCYTHQAINHQA